MNLHNVLLVTKKEYTRVIRKPSFWLATLALPFFIGLVSFVSGYSAQQTEKKLQEEVASAKRIILVDPLQIISEQFLQEPYERSNDEALAVSLLQNGDVDGVFVYPESIFSTQEIRVYQQYDSLFTQGKFNDVARLLLEQSLILSIPDQGTALLLSTPVNVVTTSYDGVNEISLQIEKFIFPIVSVVIYFLLVFLSNNFLLMSVSEEKENRMIEIVLSIMRSTELITGKILGMTGVAFTQLGVLAVLGITIVYFTTTQFPIDINFAEIDWNWLQFLMSLFYIVSGFLIMASVMVGVGAAMPTYKDAQSFSSVFIIASIFPIYFATLIVAEPNGLIAHITSYFPLTAPLVLLARNALGELPLLEVIISSVLLLFYVIGGFYLAHKLFDLGSLEYNQKLSISRITSLFRSKD